MDFVLTDQLPCSWKLCLCFQLFETANKYHFYHSLALLGAAQCRQPAVAGTLLVAGMGMFCGALYHQALTGEVAARKVAPMGGMAMIAGWLAMLLWISPRLLWHHHHRVTLNCQSANGWRGRAARHKELSQNVTRLTAPIAASWVSPGDKVTAGLSLLPPPFLVWSLPFKYSAQDKVGKWSRVLSFCHTWIMYDDLTYSMLY